MWMQTTMNKTYNSNVILSAAGTAIGIDLMQVQQILGLIITIINLLVLIFTLGCKIYKYLKNDGKIDIDEAKDLLNDVTEIKKEIDSVEKEHKDGTN